MTEEFTICHKCKHIQNLIFCLVPRCGHSNLVQKAEVEFVTGISATREERMPYCRDINDQGHCLGYEAKT